MSSARRDVRNPGRACMVGRPDAGHRRRDLPPPERGECALLGGRMARPDERDTPGAGLCGARRESPAPSRRVRLLRMGSGAMRGRRPGRPRVDADDARSRLRSPVPMRAPPRRAHAGSMARPPGVGSRRRDPPRLPRAPLGGARPSSALGHGVEEHPGRLHRRGPSGRGSVSSDGRRGPRPRRARSSSRAGYPPASGAGPGAAGHRLRMHAG